MAILAEEEAAAEGQEPRQPRGQGDGHPPTGGRTSLGGDVQGSAKRWSPGCVNAAGKVR